MRQVLTMHLFCSIVLDPCSGILAGWKVYRLYPLMANIFGPRDCPMIFVAIHSIHPTIFHMGLSENRVHGDVVVYHGIPPYTILRHVVPTFLAATVANISQMTRKQFDDDRCLYVYIIIL